MKRIVTLLFIAAGVFSYTNSQAQRANSFAEAKTLSAMAENDLKMYGSNIVLTDVQKARISYVLESINTKILFYQTDLNMSPDRKAQMINTLEESKLNNMRGVLTPEQQKVFDIVLKAKAESTKTLTK